MRRGEGGTVNIYIKAERNRDSRRRVKVRGENRGAEQLHFQMDK
jgi:hypothetical protein